MRSKIELCMLRKHNWVLTTRVFCAFLAVQLIVSSYNSPVAAKPRVLRVSTTIPAQADLIQGAVRPWVDEVNQAFDGEAVIELFPGGSLGRHTSAFYQMVRDGVVDMAITVPSHISGQFPDNDLFQLPLVFNDALEASLTAWDMIQRGLLRGYEDVHVVAIYATLPYGLHLNFPYRTLDDISGKKIRTLGLIQARVATALGCTPIGNIIAANMAETIDRGLLDGALFGWDNLRAFGVRYVTHYHVEMPVTLSLAFISMNKNSYQSLSAKARAALDRLSGVRLTREIVRVASVAGDVVRNEVVAEGHVLVHPDRAEQALYRERLAHVSNYYVEREEGNAERYRAFLQTLAEVRRSEAGRAEQGS